MKNGFFLKTAWNNLKKNYRFFIPRILTEAGLSGCFYIIFTLRGDERLTQVRGGTYLPLCLSVGTGILILLSVILMLYTNSFLMKQRKREFGLYNVLGMEKRHVMRVLLHESLISGGISVLSGSGFGILLYKLCSLLICRLLSVDIVLGFYYITPDTLLISALFFIALDAVIYLINCVGIARLKPVELLNSRHTGEKEPKVRWLLLVLGILCLGAGYTIALTVRSPLAALLLFFAAVFLVIFGTYFLFVAGTTFVLKLLKKNKNYYYSKKHMTTVSGLLYRIKQNAVGLASICILATGVLVMISTTVSLYAGIEDTVSSNYPEHLYFSGEYGEDYDKVLPISVGMVETALRSASEKNGVTVKRLTEQHYLEVSYLIDGNSLNSSTSVSDDGWDVDRIAYCIFITAEEYEAQTGIDPSLKPGEVLLCSVSLGREPWKAGDTLGIDGEPYTVRDTLSLFPVSFRSMVSTVSCFGFVLPDEAAMNRVYEDQAAVYGRNASQLVTQYAVTFTDVRAACRVGNGIGNDLTESLQEQIRRLTGDEYYVSFHYDSIWEAEESIYGMYGSLLFLGILLGIVCLFATVLIIYYKQISEGYEDRERYQIMEKIGMSADEVRKTVHRQLILVFFLPLFMAGVHVCVAFKMLNKLLHILLLSHTSLFVLCTVAVFLAFSLIYYLIYARTARTYCKIVH